LVFITLFYPLSLCPFVTKRRSNFLCLDRECISKTGQVIFVPEWPKGEFISILASFCVWAKSLVCIKML
jgi:hypothetical protein